MKRIIVVGDIHGRNFWKSITEKEKWDKFIFIGDYFDSFDISVGEQMTNFREIAKFKEENPDKVVLLIGNHDEHYFPFMGNSGTSGYNAGAAHNYGHLLMTYKDLMQMAHSEDNILFTHAGVGETWLEQNGLYPMEDFVYTSNNIVERVNEIWKHKPLLFKFNGWEPTGDNMGQTPIWIRPRSLMKDSQNIKKAGIIQVVGHTSQKQIDIEGKATGSKYFFIDTLETSGEYLIIDNQQFKTSKI